MDELDILKLKNLYLIFRMLLISAVPLLADSNITAKDTIWSRSWAVGGGASDVCYYFVGRDGNTTRVRILYVAAYDDGASGTDYYLKDGVIRVNKIRGTKAMAGLQAKGKDDGITVAATYTLTSKSAQDALISSLGNEQLTKEQRLDISELITILKDYVPSKNEEEDTP